jgi:aspartyl-tRNA(Asn)/glutamyl-tRNA(Gln) amidotransferase subunit B
MADTSRIKTLANIISGTLLSLSTKHNIKVQEIITKDNLVIVSNLYHDKKINNQGLQTLIEYMIDHKNENVLEVVDRLSLLQISDDTTLEKIVDNVITNNYSQVEQYRSGKTTVLGYLVGQCMKESKGKGDAVKFSSILSGRLIL